MFLCTVISWMVFYATLCQRRQLMPIKSECEQEFDQKSCLTARCSQIQLPSRLTEFQENNVVMLYEHIMEMS